MHFLAALLALLLPGIAFAQESVNFPSLDSALTGGPPTALTGFLWKPDGNGPFPAVVMMHGCAGGFFANGQPHPIYRQWGQLFAKEGYVALLVDGFHPRGYQEVCTRKERPILPSRERPYDAFAALKYLGSRAEVDLARVAIAGWSHGAIATLFTIGNTLPQRAEIRAAGFQADFKAAVTFYPGCVTRAAPRWSPVGPTLMLLGANDDWTPSDPCVRLAETQAAAGHPVQHILYPNAYHGFDAPSGELHLRTDIQTVGGKTSAHVGPDPAARADALQRVPEFLATHLK